MKNSKYSLETAQGASLYSKTEEPYAYGPIISSVKLAPDGKEKESYYEKQGDIAVDTPMIVMKRQIDNETIELSFCEPTQLKQNVCLTLDGLYELESPVGDVSVIPSENKTVIKAVTQKGRSYTLRLHKK